MKNLRTALETLDEALDHLDELVTWQRPSATILPLFHTDERRDEIIRRLDQTIVDVQSMLGNAA